MARKKVGKPKAKSPSGLAVEMSPAEFYAAYEVQRTTNGFSWPVIPPPPNPLAGWPSLPEILQAIARMAQVLGHPIVIKP